VQLLVSELTTNAIKFACPPSSGPAHRDRADAKTIVLVLWHHAGALVIEVRDPGPAPPLLTEAGPDAEHGRGLMLVQALSKEWGCYHPPTGGKSVYCIISAGTT